jgi:molybdopterin-guanine dinucleotide biosynthesis protein B
VRAEQGSAPLLGELRFGVCYYAFWCEFFDNELLETQGMKILGIVGYSGSGKTRLLARLIPELRSAGLTVSTMKHTHHSVRVDEPDDISRQLTEAGAVDVAVAGRERWALLHENREGPEPVVEELAAHMTPVDLLLVEGFKRHAHPKIEVHRPSVGKPLLCRDDPNVIAVATDGPLPVTGLPVLDLNDPTAIANFIIAQITPSGPQDDYHIRRAGVADAALLPEIERDGTEALCELGVIEIASLPPLRAEHYRAAIEAGRVWVAVDPADRAVGFAAATVIDGRAHLAEIDVLRAHGRRGIGRRLVGTVTDWARKSGYAELTLTTFRDVPLNGPFYATLGFRPIEPGADRPELAAIREAEDKMGLPHPRIAMRLPL